MTVPAPSASKRLSLLRHAKSSWDDPALADHDRPLNPRGVHSALLMGHYLSRRAERPDLILASTALRARQTVEHLLEGLGETLPVESDPALYLAEAEQILACVQALDDGLRHVLLVGHNPGLHDFALCLGGEAGTGDLRLQRKFPTAALAIFALRRRRWARTRCDDGVLEVYVTPKDLV